MTSSQRTGNDMIKLKERTSNPVIFSKSTFVGRLCSQNSGIVYPTKIPNMPPKGKDVGKQEREAMKCRFATTCCAIWKERNRTLFLGSPPQVDDLIGNIMNLIVEYANVNKDQSHTRNEPNSHMETKGVWKQPSSDTMKINVDDSFYPLTRNVGTRIIVRNEHGSLLRASGSQFYCIHALETKARAVLEVLKLE
ncbi:hypothetical protein SAY87_011687 [Trapa incisa]|uniref:RNase H type-1 domain-containing protein n=1 Tax=Trapa incisa TaxID=236973 RepID=A0AAN7JJ87_9MYRT|nr:hypothetical protein SAY87_011687 [Trapa incisa]